MDETKDTGKVKGKSKRGPHRDPLDPGKVGSRISENPTPSVSGGEREKTPLLPGQFAKKRTPEEEAEEEAVWLAHYQTLSKWEKARFDSAPKRYQGAYRRVLLGKGTRNLSIKVGCQACMGWEDLPASVRDCAAKACHSYFYRPYQKKPKETKA
jgi:hypothetical protein